jgi:hypothetical protein
MSVNINPQPLANKWNVCTPAQTFSAPSREEQIATLRDAQQPINARLSQTIY